MKDNETRVDPDLLHKHGRNMEERLLDLDSALEAARSRTALTPSDFGTTQEARDAAWSYADASDALNAAMAALSRAGESHARAMRAAAVLFRQADEDAAARTRDPGPRDHLPDVMS
ncbi:hypothetical protein [Amycolatopsis pigmentata]|uniref:Excreted virulence factor EspC, type VII ESX diderm n=1 Tax=Amycolatopsis pigmentata TaxID=450801 RepID=A0ABW5G7D3_9PSEU